MCHRAILRETSRSEWVKCSFAFSSKLSKVFLYLNSYLLTLEAISRACSGHPKGRLSFGSLSLWKILAMIIAEGLLNVASKIKNRPWFVWSPLGAALIPVMTSRLAHAPSSSSLLGAIALPIGFWKLSEVYARLCYKLEHTVQTYKRV